jgi:hypothetical protein
MAQETDIRIRSALLNREQVVENTSSLLPMKMY